MKTIKVWLALSGRRVQTDMDDLPMLFKTKAGAMDGGFEAIQATLKFYVPRRDPWRRVLDECGQVKCAANGCDTWVNYDYPDGSKRTYCAEHEPEEA